MAIFRVRKGAQPGAVFPVFSSREPTVIGREGQVDIALGDSKASRKHASIFLETGHWILEDLQSSNGTIVQGTKVEKTILPDGAHIQIGGTLLSFHAGEVVAPPECEIHGAVPLESIMEQSGVFQFRARQAALDGKSAAIGFFRLEK